MPNQNKKTKQKSPPLKTPKYDGGNVALKAFITNNLQYPKEAFEKNIEGSVFLSFVVNSLGEVSQVQVNKGIGYGCDEEAVRLVNLLKYEKAINRGIRSAFNMKIKINFQLNKKVEPQEPEIVYHFVPQEKNNTLNYTIDY